VSNILINPYSVVAGGTPFVNDYSVDFDGVNDWVETANITELDGVAAFTFSGWIYFDTTSTMSFITKWDEGSQHQFAIQRNSGVAPGGGEIRVYIATSLTGGMASDTVDGVSISAWHHIAVVYDGTEAAADRIKIYIDGSSVAVTNYGTVPTTLTSATSTVKLGSFGGTLTRYMGGNLDEMALWASALTAGNITTIYNSGLPASLSDLSPVAWWRMGDGDTYPYLDNTQAFSKRSLDFDGVNDYVTMGDVLNAYMEWNVAFSVSFWMNADSISSVLSLVSKQDTSDDYRGLNIYTQSSKIRASLTRENSTGKKIVVNGGTTLSNSIWYHIALTYDGSANASGMLIYVNGAVETMTIVSDGLDGTTTNSANFEIAARDGSGLPFDGDIDDVALIASELSAANVSTIYNSGQPNDISGFSPIGYWKMGDGDTYPTITDSGSGSNNGTMTNMTAADIIGQTPKGYGGEMINMTSGDIVADVPT